MFEYERNYRPDVQTVRVTCDSNALICERFTYESANDHADRITRLQAKLAALRLRRVERIRDKHNDSIFLSITRSGRVQTRYGVKPNGTPIAVFSHDVSRRHVEQVARRGHVPGWIGREEIFEMLEGDGGHTDNALMKLWPDLEGAGYVSEDLY